MGRQSQAFSSAAQHMPGKCDVLSLMPETNKETIKQKGNGKRVYESR